MLKRIFSKLFQNKNQKWTFYAQIARLFSGFVFIGLLARTLPSEMLGTWYIFVSLFGVASLVEMGLGQVIGRHAAYLKADYDLGRITSADFLKFVKIGERFYLILISTIGLIAVPAGLWWFGYQHAEWNVSATMTVAWLVYVCGGMLTIFGAYYAALVNGVGQMWQTQRVAIFAAVMSITVLLSLLVLPAMLLIPATALLLSQLFVVILLRKTLFKLDITETAMSSSETELLDTAEALRSIAKDAAKMFLIMIYYQLLTNGFVLVLSKYISNQEIASYGITMQLIGVVISFSIIWSKSNFFEMAATRQSGDVSKLRQIFFSGLTRALGMSFLGMMGVFFVAPSALSILGSKTNLPEPMLLAIILSVIWIEFGLTQLSQMLIAMGNMRVAYFSLFAAIIICIATMFLLAHKYALIEVFITRIILYFIFIGIPILIMVNKVLRNRGAVNEAA